MWYWIIQQIIRVSLFLGLICYTTNNLRNEMLKNKCNVQGFLKLNRLDAAVNPMYFVCYFCIKLPPLYICLINMKGH